ncbi:MAG: hypothetical protein IJ461_03460, partial [Clostridia bacterium]|nr:hypothetical protein [Clostridia bacterium]
MERMTLMAWWIVYAAILGLGGVALVYAFQQIRQRRDELNGSLLMDVPLCRHEMEAHIKHIASRRLEGRRQLLRTRSGFQRRLAKLTKLLGAIDEKDLLPGLKWIRENARVLEEDWLSLKEILRSAPSLPADGKGEIFITRFSREIVSHTNAVFTGETLIRSLMSWQAVAPFTLRERWMIPLALRYTLMNFILSRGWQLWSVQRQRAQGLKMASELSGRKSNSAQKRLAASSGGAAFWEAVITGLRKSDNPSANAFLAEHLARLELDGERLVSQELHRQAVDQMWLGNAITSLKRIDRVDWDLMLEALDPVDALLRQDSVYASMDQESRGFYRSRVQRLAALSGQEEIRLAGAICSLAQTGEADGVHNHTGYYLLEDAGLKALGAYLKIHSLRWRIYLFSRHRSAALYRSVLFAGVIAGVFLCFWLNLPLWLFFPTGILFSQGTRWLLRRAISRFVPVRMLPRLNVSPLAPDKQTLVVCPTLLTTPKQAMAMVRQLAILHHASPDPRLHFMLLGDFGDSMTREQTADQAIVASAKAGIEALNETLPTQFFYLQRERFYDPKQRSYISRERKRGSLESLNRLLAGQAPKDAYTYASCDMQQLAGKYAYVITLDSDTFLPPGAAFRLIGAISHPLQMRRKLGGEMRGVSVVAPRMQVLATSVHSRLSSL